MTQNGAPPIDPRFDPVFQPGFDPRRYPDEQTATPDVTHPSAAVAQETLVVAQETATAPPPFGPPAHVPVALVALEELPSLPDAAAALRNPFLIMLLAVAAALIGGGIWVHVTASTAYQSIVSNPDYYSGLDSSEIDLQQDLAALQTAIAAAPLMVLLGSATAIGVLFVLAVRWRPRSVPEDL